MVAVSGLLRVDAMSPGVVAKAFGAMALQPIRSCLPLELPLWGCLAECMTVVFAYMPTRLCVYMAGRDAGRPTSCPGCRDC